MNDRPEAHTAYTDELHSLNIIEMFVSSSFQLIS